MPEVTRRKICLVRCIHFNIFCPSSVPVLCIYVYIYIYITGPGSSVGIATDYGLDGLGLNTGRTRFSARPDRPWDPPSLLYNGHRFFPGGKLRPGHVADHSPPSSAAVMEEYSYTSTHLLGHTGPVTASLYFTFYVIKEVW